MVQKEGFLNDFNIVRLTQEEAGFHVSQTQAHGHIFQLFQIHGQNFELWHVYHSSEFECSVSIIFHNKMNSSIFL